MSDPFEILEIWKQDARKAERERDILVKQLAEANAKIKTQLVIIDAMARRIEDFVK